MNKKVEIEITDGHYFAPGTYNGMAFTSVRYSASTYGGSSPCKCEEEIKRSVENAKFTIKNAGDTPILNDKRVTLNKWL
jgi:hypothetical protein